MEQEEHEKTQLTIDNRKEATSQIAPEAKQKTYQKLVQFQELTICNVRNYSGEFILGDVQVAQLRGRAVVTGQGSRKLVLAQVHQANGGNFENAARYGALEQVARNVNRLEAFQSTKRVRELAPKVVIADCQYLCAGGKKNGTDRG